MSTIQNPGVIVLVPDDADEFKWLSDGWYSIKDQGKPEHDALMEKAHQCIVDGENVPDVIRRLQEVGFNVTRDESLHDMAERYAAVPEEEKRAAVETFDRIFGNQN